MAFAFIQSRSKQNSGVFSDTISFSSSNTVGNLIIVAIGAKAPGAGSSTIPSISDSKSNSYALITDTGLSIDSDTANCIFYAKNIAGGPNTITLDWTPFSASYGVAIAEYSGEDQTSGPTANNTNAGDTSSISTGSISPAAPSSLYVASMSHDYSASATSLTIGGGFTNRETLTSVGASGLPISFGDLFGTGTQSAIWTAGTIVPWGATIASFKTPLFGANMSSFIIGVN